MKIEDHDTVEIYSEFHKRALMCSVCGVSGKSDHFQYLNAKYEQNIKINRVKPRNDSQGSFIGEYDFVCDACHYAWLLKSHIRSAENSIVELTKTIEKLKKPNCDMCQTDVVNNSGNKVCGYCGSPSYNDCVCDIVSLYNTTRRLAYMKKHDKIYSLRSGGIRCISYGTSFVCPVHGPFTGPQVKIRPKG